MYLIAAYKQEGTGLHEKIPVVPKRYRYSIEVECSEEEQFLLEKLLREPREISLTTTST